MNTETLDKIDALVAEKVMGWTLCDRVANGWGIGPPVWSTNNEDSPTYQCFIPTRDPAAMMEVKEKMREEGWACMELSSAAQMSKPGMTGFRRGNWAVRDGDGASWVLGTGPLAVALASLKAVGVEIPIQQEAPGE